MRTGAVGCVSELTIAIYTQAWFSLSYHYIFFEWSKKVQILEKAEVTMYGLINKTPSFYNL